MRIDRLKLTVLLTAVIAAAVLGWALLHPHWHFHTLQKSVETIRHAGMWSAALLSGLIIVQALIPFVPFAVLAGINVLLFGFIEGFVLSWISAVIGSTVMFWVVRLCAQDFFVKKLAGQKYYEKFAHLLQNNGFQVILAARLIPVIPLSVVNLSAAVSPMRFRAFFFASLIGKLPIIAAECALAAGLLNAKQHVLLFLLGASGLLVIAGISFLLRKKLIR
ncbi:MAG: hypothetical protein JWN30_212 [Bacilli bacterium]|nr:hypothetical protein [Bacilli bacterium]